MKRNFIDLAIITISFTVVILLTLWFAHAVVLPNVTPPSGLRVYIDPAVYEYMQKEKL